MPSITKKTVNVRELVNSYQANCDRIKEIADACEKEQRERSKEENAEYANLLRENNLIQMKMQAAAADHLRENPNAGEDAIKLIRENAKKGSKTEIVFMREIMTVADIKEGSIIPLNIQDILQPLTEGFILDKVGLPMPTGLSGDFVWPMYEMVEAQLAGEGVALADTKIPFSKMTASPERAGIAIPVSNQSLNQSNGLLETIVRQIMPRAIRMLLNKILFSTEKVNGATNLIGPFVGKLATVVPLSSTPTFEELNSKMKAKVLETGIEGDNLCWTLTKSLNAILEGTPVNEKGIYRPISENGKICGEPVYTTNCMRKAVKSYYKYSSSGSKWEAYNSFNPESDTITYRVSGDSATHALATISGATNAQIAEVTVVTEYVGLGDWRYQPMGMFGSLRFIVDPYSQARKDCVDFVLNCDYATKTIRPEAFILGQVAVKA